jgi:integrase
MREGHGTRLIWRGPRGSRAGSWVIRHKEKEKRLGLGRDQRQEADEKLAEFIQDQQAHRATEGTPAQAEQPHRYRITAALALYGSEHAPACADAARIGYAIKALVPFWKNKVSSDVNQRTCREYAKFRHAQGVKDGTVRSELGKLRAALRYAVVAGALTAAPPVVVPPRPPSRDRWLERDEVARLIRAARRTPRCGHLSRFILLGVYSGTRSGAIRQLRWERSLAGGYVDLANGVLYRKAAQVVGTKKQQPPARLPKRLLRLLNIWRREDERFCENRGMEIGLLPIVHYYGARIDKLRSSWRTICKEAELDADVVAHSMRHTAITWAAQAGADPWEMCNFFGITMSELERTYMHHHPNFQSSVIAAFDKPSPRQKPAGDRRLNTEDVVQRLISREKRT